MKTTYKILIIDDDSRNIFALSAVLKAKKYQCVSALDANEGINMLLANKNIAVVLMDMMMPEMDGYEATKIIKNNPELCHIPVIAITAQAMDGDREKCLASGADAYISKPVNVENLLQEINQLMNCH